MESSSFVIVRYHRSIASDFCRTEVFFETNRRIN